jgi:hypothetical protein
MTCIILLDFWVPAMVSSTPVAISIRSENNYFLQTPQSQLNPLLETPSRICVAATQPTIPGSALRSRSDIISFKLTLNLSANPAFYAPDHVRWGFPTILPFVNPLELAWDTGVETA